MTIESRQYRIIRLCCLCLLIARLNVHANTINKSMMQILFQSKSVLILRPFVNSIDNYVILSPECIQVYDRVCSSSKASINRNNWLHKSKPLTAKGRCNCLDGNSYTNFVKFQFRLNIVVYGIVGKVISYRI